MAEIIVREAKDAGVYRVGNWKGITCAKKQPQKSFGETPTNLWLRESLTGQDRDLPHGRCCGIMNTA